MTIEVESEQQRYQDAKGPRERYESLYPLLDSRRRLQDLERNAARYEAGLERRDRWLCGARCQY